MVGCQGQLKAGKVRTPDITSSAWRFDKLALPWFDKLTMPWFDKLTMPWFDKLTMPFEPKGRRTQRSSGLGGSAEHNGRLV